MTWEHIVIIALWLVGWVMWEAMTKGKGGRFAWVIGATWPVLMPLIVLSVLLDSER
jgi:hypothetical protein